MKAHMEANGTITVTPENSMEAYAMTMWKENNGALHVDPTWPPMLRITGTTMLDCRTQHQPV